MFRLFFFGGGGGGAQAWSESSKWALGSPEFSELRVCFEFGVEVKSFLKSKGCAEFVSGSLGLGGFDLHWDLRFMSWEPDGDKTVAPVGFSCPLTLNAGPKP